MGRFCHVCGHDSRPPSRRFRDLADDLLDNVFSFTTAAPRTLRDLILRPGAIPRAHFDGDRSRYLSPVKLYLTASLIFFLFLGLSGISMMQLQVTRTGEPWVRSTSEEWQAGGFEILPVWLERPLNQRPDPAVVAAFDVASRQQQDSDDVDRAVMTVMRSTIEDPSALNQALGDWMPQAIWVLMPIYALMLWGLYARRHLLIEHLIFALWGHSLMFLMLMAGGLWNLALGGGIQLAFLGYQVWLTRGLKAFYGTRWSTAILRGGLHSFVYVLLIWVPLLIVFFLWEPIKTGGWSYLLD
ncbi:DUF3667 domain-containing protein [Brevundimonas sp. R86498]|uniref:DUF3667 domain-containing protein n=1 Tax=Brevundimonas sp. R86498 TaxID=3093845 RepID=UPI0037C75F25